MQNKLFFMLLLAAFTLRLSAQTTITGRVIGDDEPDGLIAASVAEQDKNGRILTAVQTDFDGNYSIP